MAAYIEGAMELIDDDVERARSLENVLLHTCAKLGPHPFNLKSIETYFEYRCSDPIRTVIDLHPLLESFGDLEVKGKNYPTETANWAKNSVTVTLQLKAGVRLKVYAKTDKRIRFEVTHNLAHARFPETKGASKHTFRNLKGVVTRINELRDDAAREVNEVFAHLRNRANIPATDNTTIDLLFDIARVLESRQNARVVISTLCHKGSITTTKELAVALRKLKRAGILETRDRNRRQEYVVQGPYKFPLQMLQLHGSVTCLGVRKRTRQV